MTITASSTRTVETTVIAGSEGGTAVTPAVALLVNIDEQVTARLAPVSIGTLSAGGIITITATHNSTFTTKAEAEAAGDNAVGADLAMNVVLGWSTTAALDRSATGDSVSITADSTMVSTAEAEASAEGASSTDSDTNADNKSNKQVNGTNPNTTGKTGGESVPSANNNASTGNSNASSQSGSSGGSVGIAAAIAVNWVVTDNVARIGNNAHVTGGTGQVKVSAKNQNDSSAKAYGLSTNLNNSNNIAAAVGLNVVDVANTASVGDDAHVEGVGITVEAITPTDPTEQRNDFVVWGLAGAGGKSDFSVSASVAIQVINYETTAKVQKGADLESTGGITVHATAFLGLQSLALAGGLSIGGTAVGASLVVNIVQDFATAAFIDSGTGVGSITHVNATGAIQVKAEAKLLPIVPDPDVTKITFPALTSVAVAGGAGTGNLSISGSILIDVWDLSTQAYIADGAQVNQTTAGGTGQTIDVIATDETKVVNVAGALALSSGGAGIGIGLVVSVVNKDVRAYVGKSADVNAGGTVKIHATSTENWHVIAVNGAASANSAAVTGSILVVVVNAGSGPPGVYAYVDGGVGQGSSVHSDEDVEIKSSNTVDMLLLAGGLAFGSSAGIGIAAAILDRDGRAQAWAGREASIEAKGATGLTISATQSDDLILLALGGAGGGDAGVAGSVAVGIVTNQTYAFVDEDATINAVNTGADATQGIAISATDNTSIVSTAGALAIGGSAGVGAGVDVEVLDKDTSAWIGEDVVANARGNITVDATSSESLTSVSVGAGIGGTAGVTVNAAVSAHEVTTQAYVDDDATITADGSVRIAADERLDLDIIAGNISAAGSAAVGAAAAVPVITKETHAWIGDGATVIGKGGSALEVKNGQYTVATQDTRFNGGTAVVDSETLDVGFAHGFSDGQQVVYDRGGGGSAIGGLTTGTAYFVVLVGGQPNRLKLKSVLGSGQPGSLVTTLSAGSGVNHRLVPTNQAGVRQDESPRFDPNPDVSGNTINLPYSLGAATNDTVIYSSGGGDPIGGLVDGKKYYAIHMGGDSYQLSLTEGGGAITLDKTKATGRSHSLVEEGDMPSADASATGPRTVTAGTIPLFRGVAVTANNSDDIATVGVSAAASGGASVAVSGAVDILTVNTSAHIGSSARVNCAPITCGNGGANSGQSVLVAAANQYYGIVVAASVAGGTVGVGPGVSVGVIELNTDAYVDDSAIVNAANDITILATGKDSLISVTVGIAGGVVGVGGAVSVNVITTHTYANTGDLVTLSAGNNILIAARDDTKIIAIAGAIAGGFVGIGLSVAVTNVTKDTQAFIGGTNTIDARAQGSGLAASGCSNPRNKNPYCVFTGVLEGSGFQTISGFRGLAVQAASTEDVFGLVIAGGGGFVGIGGAVGVTLLHATTKAFIGGSSNVNSDTAGANAAQSVNVSAADWFKSLTIGGGAAGGFVGVGAGVDIGVAQTTTQASIGTSATVRARANVDVNAVARKEVQTYAIAVAGGFVGVGGSVAVWTVGVQPTTTYNDGAYGPDKGTWSGATTYNKGDTVTHLGKRYGSKVENNLNFDPTTNPSKWQGDASSLKQVGGDCGQHDGVQRGRVRDRLRRPGRSEHLHPVPVAHGRQPGQRPGDQPRRLAAVRRHAAG